MCVSVLSLVLPPHPTSVRAFLGPFLSLLNHEEKLCWLYVRRNPRLAKFAARALDRIGAGTAFTEEDGNDLESENGIVNATRIESDGSIAGIHRGSAALDEHYRYRCSAVCKD